jgi:dUTP pyrophosphatase
MASKLKFLRIESEAILPSRATNNSAGLDLWSISDVDIPAGEWRACKTGLAVQIPYGSYGRIAPRSGMAAKWGIGVLAGVIDSDYRGEIVCLLINHSNELVSIKKGERIAQLIVENIAILDPEWALELEGSDRGGKGFGSSG